MASCWLQPLHTVWPRSVRRGPSVFLLLRTSSTVPRIKPTASSPRARVQGAKVIERIRELSAWGELTVDHDNCTKESDPVVDRVLQSPQVLSHSGCSRCSGRLNRACKGLPSTFAPSSSGEVAAASTCEGSIRHGYAGSLNCTRVGEPHWSSPSARKRVRRSRNGRLACAAWGITPCPTPLPKP